MSLSPSSHSMDLPSSPPDMTMGSPQLPKLPPSIRVGTPKKERRQTSITPRRFRKFFDNKAATMSMSSPSGRALKALVNNRQGTQSSPLKPFNNMEDLSGQENEELVSMPREFKRRKTTHGDVGADIGTDIDCSFRDQTQYGQSHRGSLKITSSYPKSQSILEDVGEEGEEGKDIIESVSREPLERIVPFENRGLSARLLQLSLGTSRSRRANLAYAVNDWRDETASFYSRPEDVSHTSSLLGGRDSIPFCNAGLNTNSLVAIGDDEGRIRLVESEKNGKPSFSSVYLGWQVHKNAIIDLSLSDDDSLIATASGDLSAKVSDMTTQKPISILANHSATLKQVRFQPGANNKNVLATSGRDGSVQIWDLRCKGDDGPIMEMQKLPGESIPRCGNVNGILDAHHGSHSHEPKPTANSRSLSAAKKQRIGDISVTSIQFLPPGQEHLLLTGSESNSIVKLWDIRNCSNKRKSSQPVAYTKQIPSHVGNRPFGITSLSMSHDGSRFYSVCKDNVVYAYSTSHLILGHAPEFESGNGKRTAQRAAQEGLGPLYGLRHPSFHVANFYIKSAIRKPVNGNSELLAVGSNDGTPILFPTDERYLGTKANTSIPLEGVAQQSRTLSSTSLSRSGRLHSALWESRKDTSAEDPVPIYAHGTALIRGHAREVSSLSWTSNGELICADDDWNVRCWREGRDARDLRMGGETGGRRWGCGWADVEENYDDEDE
ncbi:hypothetical protein BHYA_0315g00030 [Botrytis hyacinthi]|uniref:Uncharacterized protein n=1 Tax=Botrytis hyacinthi TaxID=278943 RepID=A0A4Z1GAP7_9HELO|nr:hypothetical protein BHYA_0315g00030 [Botrytis hyacinthi]